MKTHPAIFLSVENLWRQDESLSVFLLSLVSHVVFGLVHAWTGDVDCFTFYRQTVQEHKYPLLGCHNLKKKRWHLIIQIWKVRSPCFRGAYCIPILMMRKIDGQFYHIVLSAILWSTLYVSFNHSSKKSYRYMVENINIGAKSFSKIISPMIF